MEIDIPEIDLNKLAKAIYKINISNGWQVATPSDWEDNYATDGNGNIIEQNIIPQKLALIHSEVSESIEWYRQRGKEGYKLDDKVYTLKQLEKKFPHLCDHYSDQPKWGGATTIEMLIEALPKYTDKDIRQEFGTDLIDIMVRTMSLAYGMGFDIETLMKDKLEKNKKRGIRHGGQRI